jgi:hypothetical protein
MTSRAVCVGGVDLDNRKSLRLLYWQGQQESFTDCPYNIRDIWEMDYRHEPQSPLPHSEDVCVTVRKIYGRLSAEIRLIDILQKLNFQIYRDDIRNTFEAKLQATDSGIFYISHLAIPYRSTCFWICDRNLWRNDVNQKIRFRYDDGSRIWGYHITYVGVEERPPQIIPQNTLLRLSLARWWAPDRSKEAERCYLQFSGWYDLP